MSAQQKNGRVVVVLGMHRSGTSVVTRCIHLLGAELARQVIPTDAAINRDGFFEDAKVVALNDELLALHGSCWYDFRPLPLEAANPESITAWQIQALAHLQEEYAGKKLSVVKDPRLSRLWSCWAPLFEQAGLNEELVHIIRQPEQVAMSLKRRNGMPLAYGLLLWTAHIIDTLNAEENAAGCTTLFYDSLVNDSHKNVKLIAAMLGADIAGTQDYSYVDEAIGKPRSSTPPSSDDELTLIQELHDFAAQLYRFLQNNCADSKLVVGRNELKRLNSDYQQLLSNCSLVFDSLRVLTNKLMFLNSERVKIGELHSHAQSIVAERDEQLTRLNSELKRVGAELEYAQTIVVERDEQLVERGEQVAGLNEQAAKLNQKVADLNEQIARYENVWFRRIWRYIRRTFL